MPSLEYDIFLINSSKNPRFDEHEWLILMLQSLCNNWAEYLKHHISITNNLFGAPEFPWDQDISNERVLISTLAASIVRGNSNAIIAEELPVTKSSSASANNAGRCDLWAHLPQENNKPFSFYLEAKKFRRPRKTNEIEKLMRGENGIQRMLFDYAKSRDGHLDQRSAYSNTRPHDHYIIGLICVPIHEENIKTTHIKDEFLKAFSGTYGLENGSKRRICRFPTVGLHITQPDKNAAMLTSLTVLGRS